VAKNGADTVITFAVLASTDVEVAVLNAEGRVVRSLAAGVLGDKNPPPAPLQPGLSQKLSWDGKGDWNLPVGSGPFKVRVRLGMGAAYGGTVGDSPYNFRGMTCHGMTVDSKNGDLYYFFKRGRDQQLLCLRVYDRNGRYLREIMPFGERVFSDAAARAAFGANPIPGTERFAPVSRTSLWPVYYPVTSNDGNAAPVEALGLFGWDPAAPGTLLLSDGYFTAFWRVRAEDGRPGSPFAQALWPKDKGPGPAAVGPVTGACSPDGKSIYFTALCRPAPAGSRQNPDWPEGRIYRWDAAASQMTVFADVPLPEGWVPAPQPWGTPSNGFQSLGGIEVAQDGTVLVCDTAAGKVRMFGADGKETGALEAQGAFRLGLDPRRGALYVLTRAKWRERNLGKNTVLKFAAIKPGERPVASLPLPRGGLRLAVDGSGETPQLWVADASEPYSSELERGNLLRIEEQDGGLRIAEDLAERGKAAAAVAARMAVDKDADLVYLHDGYGAYLRYDGRSGEYAGQVDAKGQPQPIMGSELCVRRDGMIYVSGATTGSYGGPWIRLNRDLNPAPLPDGRKAFADRYGKMGGGYFGSQGSCVTPDGHLYFNGMYAFRVGAIFEVLPDGQPGRGPRLTEYLSIKPAVGGFKGALIAPLQDKSGGVEIDQQGNIYAGLFVDGIGASSGGDAAKIPGTGAVVKFGPEGGAELPDPSLCKPGEQYQIYKNDPQTMPAQVKGEGAISGDYWAPGGPGKKLLDGAKRVYPLLAPFSVNCGCQTPRFDVDDYGRLYIPDAHLCMVRVLDNEGNEILRFGRYANFDGAATAAEDKAWGIPTAYPVAAKATGKHIYVADSANRRVLRVDPVWAAEATCPVPE
jgi:sugar lactone lactonase YvrE